MVSLVCFDGINEKAEMSWFDFNRCVSDWQPITQNEETEIVLFMNNEISETKMKELQTGKIVNESWAQKLGKNVYKKYSYNKNYWGRHNNQSKIGYEALKMKKLGGLPPILQHSLRNACVPL